MNADFFRLTTSDNIQLHGILWMPEQKTEKVLLHIHGMGGNFYENTFLDSMRDALLKSDRAFFSINTRGHDIIADFVVPGDEEKFKRIGNAYERFEDCVHDIKAALDALEQKGYVDIILCGHSLGACKVAYYVAKTQDARVKKLVLMSPPDMVALGENEKKHQELLALSKLMIEEGKGAELLPGKIWDWYLLSATTYVDLNTRGNPVDIFNLYDPIAPSLMNNITVPLLAFFGEKDDAATLPKEEALAILKKKATNAPTFDTDIIPQASHGYFGQERVMADCLVRWIG